jgi:hypothetical protein
MHARAINVSATCVMYIHRQNSECLFNRIFKKPYKYEHFPFTTYGGGDTIRGNIIIRDTIY